MQADYCLYYFPVTRICLLAEIIVVKGKCFLTYLYRSPSHNDNKLEKFCSDLNFPLDEVNGNGPTCLLL